MLRIPEPWTVCPKCGGRCVVYMRGLVACGGSVAMRIVMHCQKCHDEQTHVDPEMVTL